jgi:4-hydroxybenzoate polyprenyltransferase
MTLLRNLRATLEMIKWEHSVFALPFALCGAMLAADGLPTAHQGIWIVVAMIAARSAAMAFNRLADAAIDAANPRTQTRALPARTLGAGFVTAFVIVSGTVFVIAAGSGSGAFVLVYQAVHTMVAFHSGSIARYGSSGSLDCGARLAGFAYPVADCGSHFLGCGL